MARFNKGHPQLKGCIAWWPMLEGGGQILRDVYSLQNISDVWTGATWGPAPSGGYGVDFDGSGDTISASTPVQNFLDVLTNDDPGFTLYVSFYIRSFGEGGFGHIITCDDSSDYNLRLYLRSASVSDVRYGGPTGGAGSEGSGIVDPNLGFALTPPGHMQIVLQQGNTTDHGFNGKLYGRKNNGPIGSAEQTGRWPGAPSTATAFRIGNRNDGSRSFDGVVFQVRIYDRVLSEAEIRGIFNNPWAPFERRTLYPVVVAVTAPAAETNVKLIGVTNPSKIMGVDTDTISKVMGVSL